MRGFNEDQIIPFGMFAREEGVVVRFIEFMPLEEDRVWSPNTVVTLDEILARMAEYRPLVEIPHARSETARRYRFDDGIGEIGIIAPVSHPFCGHCSRIRITSDGKIRTCLFSVWDHDLHAPDAPRRQRTKNWRNSFAASSRRKKSATTSANPISCPHRGPWSTSAAEQVLWRTGVVARRGIAPVLHYRAQVSPQFVSP